jgi:hypothetical protein
VKDSAVKLQVIWVMEELLEMLAAQEELVIILLFHIQEEMVQMVEAEAEVDGVYHFLNNIFLVLAVMVLSHHYLYILMAHHLELVEAAEVAVVKEVTLIQAEMLVILTLVLVALLLLLPIIMVVEEVVDALETEVVLLGLVVATAVQGE